MALSSVFLPKQLTEVLSSYIGEEKLNLQIKTTTDISLLRTVLELKLALVLGKYHGTVDFSIDNILHQMHTSSIDEICTILYSALRVQSNETQYLILLQYLNTHLTTINDESSTINMLKLLQVALNLCDFGSNRKEAFNQFVEKSNFNDIVCKILFINSRTVENFTSVYILPKYLHTVSSVKSVLEIIWKNTLQTRSLSILCTIPEFFLKAHADTICSYSLTNSNSFWFLLQDSLGSNNSILQKQALYLAKRAMQAIEMKDSFMTESKVIFWDVHSKIEFNTAWQNLVMLFEISKEKQLHLIEPAYHLLPTIKVLHSSWLVCIFKILLNHPHSAISAYAILDVLKSSWYYDADSYKTVVSYLLIALNKIEYVDKQEIWSDLYKFSSRLDNGKLITLLGQSTAVSWIPSVCYKFYKSVFNEHCQLSISLELTENILSKTEQLPHKFIRNGCIDLVAGFITKSFLSCTKSNFTDYVALHSILSRVNYSLDDSLNSVDYTGYITDIKKIIATWTDSTLKTDLKQLQVILKLIQLPLLEDDWCEEYLLLPFMEKKIGLEISDHLCGFLSSKGMISNSTLVSYIKDRLINFEGTEKLDCNSVLALLIMSTDNDETELTNLLDTCVEILLNDTKNELQLELAFEMLTVILKSKHSACKVMSSESNSLDKVLDVWKEFFLKGNKKCKASMCLSFLQLFCSRELKKTVHIRNNVEVDFATFKNLEEAIAIFEKMIEAQDNLVIPQIFLNLKFLLNQCESVEVVFRFVDLCVKHLLQLKRTDIFKTAVENFVQSLFTNASILNGDRNVVEKTLNVTWTLLDLSKSCDDVAYSLVKHLRCLSNFDRSTVILFIPIIAELLLFGDVLRKDQRAEYLTCQEIDADQQRLICENNPNFRRVSVRAQAVNIVQHVLNNVDVERQSAIADPLTIILMDKYRTHFNRRYFAHSFNHLQKLRILQALLLIHDHIKIQKQSLTDLLMDALCTESHQVSVKFLMQWLLIRLLCDDDEGLSKIKSKMESTSKVHTSTIIAFVPILYHIALWRNDETFWTSLFEMMLPWTMGAHFNLRLYAQEGIKKLYEVASERNFLRVRDKFKSAFDGIREVLQKTERKIDPIDEYAFNVFDPKAHYHLQMIYYIIPKITNVIYDEYENIMNIIEFNKGDIPEVCQQSCVLNPQQEASKNLELGLQTNTIQKKITPCMKLGTGEDIQHEHSDLIVVASLIDKTPNLGGLSRTCEVFGVKQLVLSTTNVVKNHEFQSVSMSSENWVDMLEIKVDNLQTFLLHMKEQGYFIVGAEQTSDSIQLDKYQFPRKCLLLLGHEKEGIPPNLLSLIDFCVEIPQFGLVRSLNVHVAASTFIWEYIKQHMV